MANIAPADFEIVLPASENMTCQELIAVDDKIALEPDMMFLVRVTIVAPPEATGAPPTFSTITVVDNDGMMIIFLV